MAVCDTVVHRPAHGLVRRTLSADEQAQITQAFEIFSEGGRRSAITYRELKACMKALGFPVKKKEVLRALHDHGVAGAQAATIDARDFAAILKEAFFGRDPQETVQRAFEVLDSDGTGAISLRALRAAARAAGEPLADEDLADMIDMFDANGDGVIDRDEFARIMREPDPFDVDDW